MEKLWTKDYILVCAATFLMCFSFFIIVPSLPFYLRDTFGIDRSLIGLVLACYVVSILAVRPFSGYITDRFPRKKVYCISYGCFAAAFSGYFGIASTVAAFIVLRVLHGLAFGILTTAGNTIVIDIMPSSRRGEGLGYFGVMNNLAMAVGPMVGLFIISEIGYEALFSCSLASSATGFLTVLAVKAPKKIHDIEARPRMSLDRFILTKGIPAGICLFLLAVPNAMTTSYMALYAMESGIGVNSGVFFTVMAVGLILSRTISGKKVDKGRITESITAGIATVLTGACGEALLSSASGISPLLGYADFFLSAFLLGYGFGTMFPAFNTLFINLAPNSMRATANATYLTGWDAGIGCGMLLGGLLSDCSFVLCFSVGAALSLVSLILFALFVSEHFMRNRLR